MQELMRELIMQGMQRLPERPLQAETAEVLRPQPQQALPGHAAEQAGPAIYTGRAIWQGSMPITDVISRLRQQTGPLRLQTAAAPAITAIIAVVGTIAATAATAALKNCRS